MDGSRIGFSCELEKCNFGLYDLAQSPLITGMVQEAATVPTTTRALRAVFILLLGVIGWKLAQQHFNPDAAAANTA